MFLRTSRLLCERIYYFYCYYHLQKIIDVLTLLPIYLQCICFSISQYAIKIYKITERKKEMIEAITNKIRIYLSLRIFLVITCTEYFIWSWHYVDISTNSLCWTKIFFFPINVDFTIYKQLATFLLTFLFNQKFTFPA